MKNESDVMPLDDPDNLNKYLNGISKKNNKEKTEKINIEIKDFAEKNLNNYLSNFDKQFRKFYCKFNNKYNIKYNIIKLTKNKLLLKCSDSNCNAKATIKILLEKNLGFPYPDGNIIEGNILNISIIYIGHAIFYKYMGYFLNIKKNI